MFFRSLLSKTLIVILSISTFTSFQIIANSNIEISFEDVKKDITFLASDDLKGRATFSPEIEKAADYIASRFKDIGLSPFNGSFKQTFEVYSFKPQSVVALLNGKPIKDDNIAFVSTTQQLAWQRNNDINFKIISENEDLRSVVRNANNKGGNHLFVVNTAHAELFKRYKNYFKRGLTKLSNKDNGAIVLILSNHSNIETFNVDASLEIEHESLSNVVGVIPGKSKTNEIVLFSAHHDHLGENSTADSDSIFNGADDDASGTTAVISLANYFMKKASNERTIMFATFTAEEIGGFGSKYFSNQLPPETITAMINIEMIGKPSKFGAGNFWMTGMERSNLGSIMNAALDSSKKQIYADPYPSFGLFYRSDNATLAQLGVPAHSFSSTQLDNDKHYHKVSDNLESLDLSSMYNVIQTLAEASIPLVNGSATPTRVDSTKLRTEGKIF